MKTTLRVISALSISAILSTLLIGQEQQAAAQKEVPTGPVAIEKCIDCHADQSNAFHDGIHTPKSVSDERGYPDCFTCHIDPHFDGKAECKGVTEGPLAIHERCSSCHEKDLESLEHSEHLRQLLRGNKDAPTCIDCHETHAITKPSDVRSAVHTNNVSEACESCHDDYRMRLHHDVDEGLAKISCTYCHIGHDTEVSSFQDRVNYGSGMQHCGYCHQDAHEGENLAHGKFIDPEQVGRELKCTTCHVYHWEVHDGQPTPVAAQQDCALCHKEEQADYSTSIHARSLAAGNADAPGCVDCHGENDILTADHQFTPQGVVKTCEECHADKELMLSYEINPYTVAGFETTYHGKLYDLLKTDKEFATCNSCHGHHGVLEPEDPDSMVGRQRILETCQECHEEADESFITYLVHPIRISDDDLASMAALAGVKADAAPRDGVTLNDEEDPLGIGVWGTVFLAADWFMKALFVSVMAFFILHTLLWFQRGVRERSAKPTLKYYRRFTPYERFMHILVNISFLMLAFTGLPQTFAHTGMGRWILENIMTLPTAQVLHYWAAAITLLYFVMHLAQVAVKLKKFGWRPIFTGPDSLVPQMKDWHDFVGHMKWFFNKGPKPQFDRWTYWEKFDYLAVFWGVAMIGVSGLVRWQEEFFGNLLGGGAVSLATTIHQEEALLATAFIFIVHFFNTHLRSEKFPMDVCIYTGLISEEEMIEERPEQYERLKKSGILDKYEVKVRSQTSVLLSYLWGTLALCTGLFLLVLIVIGLMNH